MTSEKVINHGRNIVLRIPDGGWGYFIALSLTIAFISTLLPISNFGIIYGKFLASVGDETTGTSIANGISLAMSNIAGLATSRLLQKYPVRVVAFMGALLYCVGTFSTIFVNTLTQFVVSFGMIQALGIGFLFPSCMTALNSYFDRKLNLVNSIAQTVIVASMIFSPYFFNYIMENYGFRGSLLLILGLGLNTVLAAALLQPVEWHWIRETAEEELLQAPNEPVTTVPEVKTSVISLADRAFSVTSLNKPSKRPFWQILSESLNLNYFKDPTYVNITVGLSLAFVSDLSFLSLIPLLLTSCGFDRDQSALLMTSYFGSDLLARMTFTAVSACCKLNNRMIFLVNVILLAVFRISFMAYDTYAWKMGNIAILGLLRCCLQTPIPMVISDQYSQDFGTAFSLYMVVLGIISLIFAPLMGWVKMLTGNDAMVVHLLTLAYLVCGFTWTVELIYKRLKRVKNYTFN